MNTLELFPEVGTWNIEKLISDINAARNKYGKGDISPRHQDYLYGALVGYNPKDISQKLGLRGDGKTVRTAFSTEINPYIRELLEYPDELNKSMNWQRACVLLEKAGYKVSHASIGGENFSVIKIKLDCDKLGVYDLQIILTKIQEMTEDKTIEIKDVRRGCIELVLSGSEAGLKRLESLVKSGELAKINGVRIISSTSDAESNKIVRLSNWLDNLVEAGWEALENLLNLQNLQLEAVRSNDVRKAKLIDRTMFDNGYAVVLALKQTRLDDGSYCVILRTYPAFEQLHLPSGIKMRIFGTDEDGNEVSKSVKAGNSDKWIQLIITGELEEKFSIEIFKDEISVVENFVI